VRSSIRIAAKGYASMAERHYTWYGRTSGRARDSQNRTVVSDRAQDSTVLKAVWQASSIVAAVGSGASSTVKRRSFIATTTSGTGHGVGAHSLDGLVQIQVVVQGNAGAMGVVDLDAQGRVWYGELSGAKAPARYSIKWTRIEERP